MGCTSILRQLITFVTSLLDLTSDFINSVRFWGHDVQMPHETWELPPPKWDLQPPNTTNTTNTQPNSNTNEQNSTTPGWGGRLFYSMTDPNFFCYECPDFIWGLIGISIMFLPGIIIQFPFILHLICDKGHRTEKLHENQTPGVIKTFLKLFGFLLYPITLIVVQIAAFFNADLRQWALGMVGMEAFFEGVAQIILQGFTIIYGHDPDRIQIATVSASFLLLAKMSIEFDILMTGKELNFRKTLVHTARALPCYTSAILFRITSITLTFAYLRYWAIYPSIILILELAVLSWHRYNDDNRIINRFTNAYFLCLSNIGVLNAYSPSTKVNNADADINEARKFIRRSATATFLHHFIILSSIMILSFCDQEYFNQEEFKDVILKPDSRDFYWVIVGTLVIGFYSLMLSYALAWKLVSIDGGQSERVEIDPDFINLRSIQTYQSKTI